MVYMGLFMDNKPCTVGKSSSTVPHMQEKVGIPLGGVIMGLGWVDLDGS